MARYRLAVPLCPYPRAEWRAWASRGQAWACRAVSCLGRLAFAANPLPCGGMGKALVRRPTISRHGSTYQGGAVYSTFAHLLDCSTARLLELTCLLLRLGYCRCRQSCLPPFFLVFLLPFPPEAAGHWTVYGYHRVNRSDSPWSRLGAGWYCALPLSQPVVPPASLPVGPPRAGQAGLVSCPPPYPHPLLGIGAALVA